jgi:membrane-associated protein
VDALRFLIDFILHVDQHLVELTRDYGLWVYGILWAIVFIETGLVVMPLLPGDSLLFAAGALAAQGALDVHLLVVLLTAAAILGNVVNYAIGRQFGAVITAPGSRWIRPEHLEKTHAFFERHGGRTIILTRFVPIVRTLAPFVAGLSRMDFHKFLFYNVVGGVLWVTGFCYAGYLFGTLPIVQQNLKLVMLAIIVVSLLPIVYEFFSHRVALRRASRRIARDN